VGARVTVVLADGRRQTAEVYAGAGYLSQSSGTLFFGTGNDIAREIHVRWPNGQETIHSVGAGSRLMTIEQTAGG
jgi:hypothetical protein